MLVLEEINASLKSPYLTESQRLALKPWIRSSLSVPCCWIAQIVVSFLQEKRSKDFPSGYKTPCFQCRGHGFSPWLGPKIPCTEWYGQKILKEKKKVHLLIPVPSIKIDIYTIYIYRYRYRYRYIYTHTHTQTFLYQHLYFYIIFWIKCLLWTTCILTCRRF